MEDKERVLKVQKKWSKNLLVLIFCTSLHTLVNKYVLSVLKFQFPTLFISWQCGICVFLLMSAHVFGYIKLSTIDRSFLKSWLPCMLLHTAVMYFGSVSLSKLAIPIFIGLQNLMYLCVELVTFWRSKLFPALSTQMSLFMIGFGAIYLFYSNWKTNPVAYKWISAYILYSGLYTLFFEVMKDTKLSDVDKIFCNSLFCVLSLTLLSIVTREWTKFFEFPFRNHGRFIIGCWCSGILYSVSSMLPHILAKEITSKVNETGIASARALVSIISLGIFEAIFKASSAFSVMTLLSGGILYTLSKFKSTTLEER